MHRKHKPLRRAFTLIELIAAIVVFSLVSMVFAGIMLESAEAYASASEARERGERASLAMDRIVRLIREIPENEAAPGTPDITDASATALELGNGAAVRLSGSTLILIVPDAPAPAVLCTEVSAFELTYLGADGMELALGAGDTTADIHRINVRLACGQIELRTSAFLRVALGGG